MRYEVTTYDTPRRLHCWHSVSLHRQNPPLYTADLTLIYTRQFTSTVLRHKVAEAYIQHLFHFCQQQCGSRAGLNWRLGRTNGRQRRRQRQHWHLPSPFTAPRALPCIDGADKTLSPSFSLNRNKEKFRRTTDRTVTTDKAGSSS